MQQITSVQLAHWLADSGRPSPMLLDVREPWEFDLCRIDSSRPMPMATVPVRLDELDPESDIVVICHHGARSFQVAMFLEQQGFAHLHNLSGGIAAWAHSVDPAMPTY